MASGSLKRQLDTARSYSVRKLVLARRVWFRALSRILGDPSGRRAAPSRTPAREEVDMNDPFVGTWTLNPTRSDFDANHKPARATMRWEVDDEGTYALFAAGVDA